MPDIFSAMGLSPDEYEIDPAKTNAAFGHFALRKKPAPLPTLSTVPSMQPSMSALQNMITNGWEKQPGARTLPPLGGASNGTPPVSMVLPIGRGPEIDPRVGRPLTSDEMRRDMQAVIRLDNQGRQVDAVTGQPLDMKFELLSSPRGQFAVPPERLGQPLLQLMTDASKQPPLPQSQPADPLSPINMPGPQVQSQMQMPPRAPLTGLPQMGMDLTGTRGGNMTSGQRGRLRGLQATIDNVAASSERMKNMPAKPDPVPGLLLDYADKLTQSLADSSPHVIRQRAANELAKEDYVELAPGAPGRSRPWQPQIPSTVPAGFDGRSGLQRILDGDAEQRRQLVEQQQQDFDASNYSTAQDKLQGMSTSGSPANASEAWQIANSNNPSALMMQLTGKRDGAAGWNQQHPRVPWGKNRDTANEGTMQIAMATGTQRGPDGSNVPFTTDQLDKQRRAQGLTSKDAGKRRFGDAYNAVVGNAADDARARKARLGEGNQSQLMRMMGVDPTSGDPLDANGGNNPMNEVMRMGMMFGPGAAQQVLRNQGDLAVAREGMGIEDKRGQYFGTLLQANPAAAANPVLRRQLWEEAKRMAEESSGAPSVASAPPSGSGQFNVPDPQVPAAPQGVNPQALQLEIGGLIGTPDAPGPLFGIIQPGASYHDIADYLSTVMGTDAQPDEQTLEMLVQYIKAMRGLDPKFAPEPTEQFPRPGNVGVHGMRQGQPGQRGKAYTDAINKQKEERRKARQQQEANADYSGPFYGG